MKKLLILSILLCAAPVHAAELTVAAAASLTNVLTEIGTSYQKSHSNTKINFNFGSSGTLQTQIAQGAPVDVFLSADDEKMDKLAAQRLIDSGTRRVVASNRLVLIVPKNSALKPRRFSDMASPNIRHIALGGPSVPAGQRAEEVFRKLGIWTLVQSKAVRTKDVRAALTQVELGNVEAGVVYATDAAISRKIRVISFAPVSMHAPIRYPAAVVSASKNQREAGHFVRFLNGQSARKIFAKYRFAPAL